MEFSRDVYWGGLLCPPPGDLPDPGIRPRSPTLQVDSFIIWVTREAPCVSQPPFIVTLEENSHPGLLEGREGVRAVAKRHADQKSESQKRGPELASGHHGARGEAALGAEAIWQEGARRGLEKTDPRITVSWGELWTRPKIFKAQMDTPPTWRNSEFILPLVLLLHYSCSK